MSPISTKKSQVYSVIDVNNAIKNVLTQNEYLKNIVVLGEISNFKGTTSGHLYFSIKDAEGVLDVVMYKWYAKNLKFTPKNGMKVFVKGSVSFYEKGGRLQFYAENMAADGVGNLHQKFEELKKKLHADGLFQPEHKKEIPAFPKTIGVVTSQTGAAVRDIITTIKRRYPIAKIELFPVVVQGEKAAPSIANAIQCLNQRKSADVLIVGRGGGSIEDLWAFNEEIVAKAIFSSAIPIISAVGHETDTTIADFVADMRAPTPTAAAEIATPFTISELQMKIQRQVLQMQSTLMKNFKQKEDILNRVHKNLLFRHPERKLGDMAQSKDILMDKMQRILDKKIEQKKNHAKQLQLRLEHRSPNQKIKEMEQKLENIHGRLHAKMDMMIKQKQHDLSKILIALDGLSPLKIMNRGYSLVYKEDSLIKDTDTLQEKDVVTVKLANGEFDATVTSISKSKGEN